MNTRLFTLVLAVLVSGGCTLRPRYADLASSSGLKEAITLKAVDEADGVELFARDTTSGKPVKGLKLLLWAGQKNYHLVSDASGRLALPASAKLLADDPMYEVTRPAGVAAVELRAGSPLDCGAPRPKDKLALKNVLRWAQADTGEDRVYLDPAAGPEAKAAALKLVADCRASLLALTGVAPPPVALAVVAGDAGVARGQLDANGRVLFAASAGTLGEAATEGSLARDWTRELLRRNVGFAAQAQGAALEQGLLDLVEHAVERLRLGAGITPRQAARLGTLERSAEIVDLLAEPKLDARCGPREAAAFAWWFDRARAEHLLVPKLFARLTQGADPRTPALVALVNELSPGGPDVRSLSTSESAALLNPAKAPAPVPDPAPAPEAVPGN
ncbi:MAG: hypothetical protein ACYC8T_09815 [Myxococcaceae bacterium]